MNILHPGWNLLRIWVSCWALNSKKNLSHCPPIFDLLFLCLLGFLRLEKQQCKEKTVSTNLKKWDYQIKPCYLENHKIKELCKDRAVCIFGFVSVTLIIKNNHTIEFVHFVVGHNTNFKFIHHSHPTSQARPSECMS